jgi:hypothetical protein
MKYVMFQDAKGVMYPVIFDDHLTHSMVKVEGCQAVSAGFVGNGGMCWGRSESLKLNADPVRDSDYVAAALCNDTSTLNMLRVMAMVEKGEG